MTFPRGPRSWRTRHRRASRCQWGRWGRRWPRSPVTSSCQPHIPTPRLIRNITVLSPALSLNSSPASSPRHSQSCSPPRPSVWSPRCSRRTRRPVIHKGPSALTLVTTAPCLASGSSGSPRPRCRMIVVRTRAPGYDGQIGAGVGRGLVFL